MRDVSTSDATKRLAAGALLIDGTWKDPKLVEVK